MSAGQFYKFSLTPNLLDTVDAAMLGRLEDQSLGVSEKKKTAVKHKYVGWA